MSDANEDHIAVERLQKLLTARKQALGAEADREEQIKQWREDVKDLMSKIREWLRPFTEGDTLQIVDIETELNEHQLGSYRLGGLDLIGPDHSVLRVRPVARFVVGASGRVDLEAMQSRTLIVRSDETGWQIVEPDRRGARHALTQASLLAAIEDLLA